MLKKKIKEQELLLKLNNIVWLFNFFFKLKNDKNAERTKKSDVNQNMLVLITQIISFILTVKINRISVHAKFNTFFLLTRGQMMIYFIFFYKRLNITEWRTYSNFTTVLK